MNFLLLDPKQIGDLTADELGGLVAYLMRREDRQISNAKMYAEWFDIELDDLGGGKEFLRCYFKPMPINAVYNLLTELQGKSFARVRLWTTSKFTPAQRDTHRDVPLAFEMLDISGLQSRLVGSQRISSDTLLANTPNQRKANNWPRRAVRMKTDSNNRRPIQHGFAHNRSKTWFPVRASRKIDWSDVLVFSCLLVAIIWIIVLIILGLPR